MKKRESLGIYLSLFLIIAVVAGVSGCAGTQAQKKDKESLLLEAGFHIRTPSTHEQWAMYNQMTPYKLERNTLKGKALYTYVDKQKGVVYIGETMRINATSNLQPSSRSSKRNSKRPIAII